MNGFGYYTHCLWMRLVTFLLYCSPLGHNSDGKYFVSNSKLAFDCKVRPQRVMVFIDKTKEGQVTPILDVEVEEVACGQNHMVSMQMVVL